MSSNENNASRIVLEIGNTVFVWLLWISNKSKPIGYCVKKVPLNGLNPEYGYFHRMPPHFKFRPIYALLLGCLMSRLYYFFESYILGTDFFVMFDLR